LLKTLREAWAQISVQAAKPPASAAVLEPALAGRNLAGAFGIPEYGAAAHQWSA
jgi:hypothetical protein